MKTLHVLAIVALLGFWAVPAPAQELTLEFQDGKVRLSAHNVTTSQILSEWARRGRTTIVNAERVPGPAVTIELQDVPEQQALDVVLRGVSGYLVAARDTEVSGASSFDRIYILPTSSRPTNAAPLAPPPQQALQLQDEFDEDDEDLPPGPRIPGVGPGSRLPRETGPINRPVPAVVEENEPVEPENPPPAPNNPFGVAPGTSRPGVISPAPPNRPNNQ